MRKGVKMFKLPEIDYGYDALGEYISKDIMSLHHSKHHQAYVDKLNKALESLDNFDGSKELDGIIKNLDDLPEFVQTAVRNNGGGHYNHSLFWKWMSPDGGGQPTGELADLLNSKYGSFQKFVDEFTTKSLVLFGSGWVWLMPTGDIITTQNQDTPIMEGQTAPILGLDVWEHAYYLDYKNKRDDYIAAWWNVVNWNFVEELYK